MKTVSIEPGGKQRGPGAETPRRERSTETSGARPASERRPARSTEEPRTGVVRRVQPSGWRCLEWSAKAKAPRERGAPPGNPKVTIVQLSATGELLRQNGPDSWLPEAGDFMQRMSTLLARSLGFAECRSLCLRNERSVLAVSAVGTSKVVAVSGPQRSMANVLRRAGLS